MFFCDKTITVILQIAFKNSVLEFRHCKQFDTYIMYVFQSKQATCLGIYVTIDINEPFITHVLKLSQLTAYFMC